MVQLNEERDPLEEVVDEFLDEYRQGRAPSLSEYTEKYPSHADDIRELFPAIIMMEQLKKPEIVPPEPPKVVSGISLEVIGDFEIVREIGRGGMGVVYEARQISLHRHVALKILPKHPLEIPKRLARFQREAQAAARLHHTNIVPIFGVGEHAGTHYYVMQFIQGCTLEQILKEIVRTGTSTTDNPVDTDGAFPPEANFGPTALSLAQDLVFQNLSKLARRNQYSSLRPLPASSLLHRLTKDARSQKRYRRNVIQIGIQVAQALEYAHSERVLHRDIKPGNLILNKQGVVWITDFGLAKILDHQSLTKSGDAIGTLRYMAPEQFEGETDERGDIYSLGLTLYELLALRPAFAETDRHRLMKQIVEEKPALLRSINNAIPRDLETIIHTAIHKDVKRRYQSASAFAEDLQAWLDQRPIKAKRAAFHERCWHWCKSNRMLSLLGILTFLSLVSVAIVSAVGYVKISRALERSEENRIEAERSRERVELAWQRTDKERHRANRNVDLMVHSLEMLLQNDAGDADGSAEQKAEKRPSKSPEFMQQVLDFYEEFAELNSVEPKLQMKALQVSIYLAQVYLENEQERKYSLEIQRASKMFQELHSQFSTLKTFRVMFVEAGLSLAEISPQDSQAIERLRKILPLATSEMAEHPRDSTKSFLLMKTLHRYGRRLWKQEEHQTAIQHLEKAFELWKSQLELSHWLEEPAEVAEQVANDLADWHLEHKEIDKAIQILEEFYSTLPQRFAAPSHNLAEQQKQTLREKRNEVITRLKVKVDSIAAQWRKNQRGKNKHLEEFLKSLQGEQP